MCVSNSELQAQLYISQPGLSADVTVETVKHTAMRNPFNFAVCVCPKRAAEPYFPFAQTSLI